MAWRAVRESVEVKLLSEDGELYILARSRARILKERGMRRRRLQKRSRTARCDFATAVLAVTAFTATPRHSTSCARNPGGDRVTDRKTRATLASGVGVPPLLTLTGVDRHHTILW